MRKIIGLGLFLATSALAASLALAQAPATTPPAATSPAAAPPKTMAPGFLAGYLPRGAAPNSLVILPPAPRAGSPAQARDDDASKVARGLRSTPRWDQATRDAELHFPAAAEAFSCALGVDINPDATPRLYVLLRRTLADAGLSTYPTKTKYQRARPFMINGGDICTPASADGLRKDGSYPSGHAAVGWAWALILAEAAPDRQDAVLARGRAFMQSRMVCNVHWLSDIEQGGVMGAAVVARLHADPVFRADLDAARAEIAAARAAAKAPTRDCKAEAAALALAPPGAP